MSDASILDGMLAVALTEPLQEPILRGRVSLVSPRLTAQKILRHAAGAVRIYPTVDHAIQALCATAQ